MYQLIAFDMDGTLLTSQKRLAKSSITAIQKAQAAGKQVVLSTGRALPELLSFQEELKSISYAVLASGAQIYDFKRQHFLADNLLPSQVVARLREIAEQQDLMVIAMIGDKVYLQQSHFETIATYHMEIYEEHYPRTATFVADIYQLLADRKNECCKINLYHINPEAREQTFQALKSEEFIIVKAEETGLEVTAKGVEKGQGLITLAQMLHVPMSQVIAVGDADNDESMIRLAGLGVAMGNANSHIKSLADVIVADNDHGGCAQAIEDYLLKV